jgi:hypothetical protein
MTTVWITRYALTTGIQSGELIKQKDRYVYISSKRGINGCEMFHGVDWHYDLADARRRAEEMRNIKLASLQKRIAEMESLNLDMVTPIEPKR